MSREFHVDASFDITLDDDDAVRYVGKETITRETAKAVVGAMLISHLGAHSLDLELD